MPTPIFTAAGGHPFPLLPLDEKGRERVPNGETILSLQEASARFRTTEDALRLLYGAAIEQFGSTGGLAAMSAETLREATELAWLHRDFYSRLSREEFVRLVGYCRKKGVDPQRLWVYPIRRHVNGKFVILFGLRAHAMRKIAEKAGLKSIGDWKYTYAEDERRPYRVGVTVVKEFEGRLISTTANADWDENYVEGHPWDIKGQACLETCALKKALRLAFPDELGDVDYTEEDPAGDRAEPVEAGELTYSMD